MIKHGHVKNQRRSPTYRTWESMKYRCSNPSYSLYQNYGGRGISYSPEWSDFRVFLADMGERPEGMTLDRIDNDKGYSKQNCRWADKKTQRHNRRDVKLYEYRGDLYMLDQLAAKHGLTINFLHQRIHRDGMTVEDAVNRPSRVKKVKAARAEERAVQ